VKDLLGRPAFLETELEVVLRRFGFREKSSHSLDLLRRRTVRRGRNREVARVEVVAGADERQRLNRLGRAAHEAGEAGVSGLGDDGAVPDGNRVHAVARLDDAVPAELDDDRFHLAGRA
jgi:hypothetical protein